MRWPSMPGAESLRYGARLAAAVLLAFAASAALHLPEGFWAVMTALIVVRPHTGSTLGAGWDRIRGALVGTALGLAGAAWRHAAGGADLAPLVLVTLLAFAAGLAPAMRSAPISALIVVTSGGLPGHSAAQVALLRALEIGIGIAAALAVSLLDLRSRATPRFRAAAAAHLQSLADAIVIDAPAPEEKDTGDATRRAALRQLAALADSADRENRVLGRAGRDGAERHRKSARLLSRITSDTALFARLRSPPHGSPVAPAAASRVERAAVDRLRAAARALAAAPPVAERPVAYAATDDGSASDARIALRLLGDDLDTLLRLEKRQPGDAARSVP